MLGEPAKYGRRMAIWTTEDYSGHDFNFMQNGFVHKFHDSGVLAESLLMFSQLGYRVVRVDASVWTGPRDMHRDISLALSFPDYYGHNLDALNDCLGDVAEQGYGWKASDTGLVFVVDNIDSFWSLAPREAFAVIDMFSGAAKRAALFGNRLLCFVRSDDPRFDPDPVGAMNVRWNPKEWLNRSRVDD